MVFNDSGTETIDTRGYECPRPKIMVCDALLYRKPAVVIALVDDAASVEALQRLAPKYGYACEMETLPGHRRMRFQRKQR